jgi:NADH-quinone oxidoreductase subunit E
LETIESQLGIKDGETTEDMEYSLETVACIGACGLSPCIVVNTQVKANMTPTRVREFLKKGEDNKA